MAKSRSSPALSRPEAASGKLQAPYTVLARRYRSRDFDELIGQEPIARTLQNAIKTNRTAHAYLFSGTRGVGKTSMARIFAKALNATDNLQQQAEIADAILRGDDLDVIEIDAASNRGIDNARELIAGASLSPARSPYKIYIIDEVHMLTREAFNALLKTMEEPPAHVKFILCTTEPHKVPATIQSRCQRFDFRTIPTSKIAQQLRRILKDEGVNTDDAVITQVARLGQGSMRDALSLLDRLLAGGEEKLTTELIEQMLGVPDHALVEQVVDAFTAGDAAAALAHGAELLNRGASVEQALELLTDHLRTLMIIAACGDGADFLDLTDDRRQAAAAQAAHFDAQALVHMIAVCDAVSRNARGSAAARALFDAALVRLCLSAHFADIPAMLASGNGPAALPRPAASPVRKTPASPEPKKKEALVADLAGADPIDHAGVPSDGTGVAPLQVFRTGETPVPAIQNPKSKIQNPDSPSLLELKPESPLGAELWARAVEVAAGSVGDRARTQHLSFHSFDGATLRLSLDEDGADIARFLSTGIDRLVDLVKRATGRTVRVELDTSRFDAAQRPPASGPSQFDQAKDVPLVQKALELFDATLVAVDELPRPSIAPAP